MQNGEGEGEVGVQDEYLDNEYVKFRFCAPNFTLQNIVTILPNRAGLEISCCYGPDL